jgi:hypothetical protein
MKPWIGSVAVALALMGSACGGEEGGGAARAYRVVCKVLEYDQDGKIKARNEPSVTMLENRPCKILVGGEMAVPTADGRIDFLETGASIRMIVQSAGSGKVRLDASAQMTWLESSPKPPLPVRSIAARAMETIRLGEAYRIELGGGSAGGDSLAFELTVQEADKDMK